MLAAPGDSSYLPSIPFIILNMQHNLSDNNPVILAIIHGTCGFVATEGILFTFCNIFLSPIASTFCYILLLNFDADFRLLWPSGEGLTNFQPQVFWCEVEISFNFSVLTSQNLIWNKQTNKNFHSSVATHHYPVHPRHHGFVSKHVVSFTTCFMLHCIFVYKPQVSFSTNGTRGTMVFCCIQINFSH